MDKIPLITELNDKTRQKDEFELALERSGFSLPSDDEGMDDDMGDMDDMEMRRGRYSAWRRQRRCGLRPA